MLTSDIQERGDALNQSKLNLGQLRLEEASLLQMTAENEDKLAKVRNDYAVAKNEFDGLKGRINDSLDDVAKWTLEEQIIEKELVDN